jgi:DNA-directed RNA polymerase specialized sigma24 family protein
VPKREENLASFALVSLQHVAAKMSRWEHARMNGFSEDLRRRIVSAAERGMSKSQAARTFDLSLSSVKRYARGWSLPSSSKGKGNRCV